MQFRCSQRAGSANQRWKGMRLTGRHQIIYTGLEADTLRKGYTVGLYWNEESGAERKRLLWSLSLGDHRHCYGRPQK